MNDLYNKCGRLIKYHTITGMNKCSGYNMLRKEMKKKKQKEDINKTVMYGDSVFDFISFYNQYDLINEIQPSSILEVGIGNGKLSMYLKQMGYDVTTCDFNEKLNPDFVGDIRELPFNDNAFNMVSAFEILEHIPFDHFKTALSELRRVTKDKVVISIPYQTYNIGGLLWIYKFHHPFFFRICEMSFKEYDILEHGIHYWEMGYKGYSRKKIEKIITEMGFKIIKRYSDCRYPVHYFFVLEKNPTSFKSEEKK